MGQTILPQSAPRYVVITALGTDRPGIVNTITRHVSNCDCNIEDSRLAMLGEEFTFIMLLSGSPEAITRLEATLPLRGAELALLIVMKRTSSVTARALPITVRVQVDVTDSPHIIERFTALFDSQRMSIAELISRTSPANDTHPSLLFISITTQGPEHSDIAAITQSFNKLCTELNAQGTISTIKHH
ncbi:MAG: Glycine cleavage system transcriptional repressor [Candidatus Erwinia impunctatus]|nr:Glycine cleavage system transcriptional repressor [Culicoides impunctatus]